MQIMKMPIGSMGIFFELRSDQCGLQRRAVLVDLEDSELGA
jgi:hypothetical protein